MKFNQNPQVLLASIISLHPGQGYALAKNVEGDQLVRLYFDTRRRYRTDGENNVFTDEPGEPSMLGPNIRVACLIGDKKEKNAFVASAWEIYTRWCNRDLAFKGSSRPAPTPRPQKTTPKTAVKSTTTSVAAAFTKAAEEKASPAAPVVLPAPQPVVTASARPDGEKMTLDPLKDGEIFLRVFGKLKRGDALYSSKGKQLAATRLKNLISRAHEFAGDDFIVEARPSDTAKNFFVSANNPFTNIAANQAPAADEKSATAQAAAA